MEKKQIRMYFVLFLGYTVLNTDAAVTITPHNALSDGISFEEGSEGVIMCTINPYLDYFTWKIDNLVAAECIPNCNVYLSAATYAFTFDTANGIFNITINSVNGTDDGKVFLCDDGSNPANFTLRVKEKRLLTDKTVTGRSWCQKWCAVTISVPVGFYFIQCVVMLILFLCIPNMSKGNEVKTELLKIESELEKNRKQFRKEVEKRYKKLHTVLAFLNEELIKAQENKLDLLDNKTKQGMSGQDEEGINQALMHEYYKKKSTILEKLAENNRLIQAFGKEEHTRRKDEIRKGFDKRLEIQALTKEEKEDQLDQILGQKIEKIIKRLPGDKLNWSTGLAELTEMEDEYRKMIQDAIIMNKTLVSTEPNQPSNRHQQNESNIKMLEKEIHRKREEMQADKQKRDVELKEMVDKKKKELETKLSEEEAKLKTLMMGNRSKTNRLKIYSVKRKILLNQRKSRDKTLLFEIAELEEDYRALPVDDLIGDETKLLASKCSYSPEKYKIVDLISQMEEKEKQYEGIIKTKELEENQNNGEVTNSTQKENSCSKCHLYIPNCGKLFIPLGGIIYLLVWVCKQKC